MTYNKMLAKRRRELMDYYFATKGEEMPLSFWWDYVPFPVFMKYKF